VDNAKTWKRSRVFNVPPEYTVSGAEILGWINFKSELRY
jgi:hypothetical protein